MFNNVLITPKQKYNNSVWRHKEICCVIYSQLVCFTLRFMRFSLLFDFVIGAPLAAQDLTQS